MHEFICLLTQHRNVLERFVRFRISNSFDADDIIQETCISAYRSFSSLKDTALFKSWIISIARNKCNDYFRQLAKNMELPIDNRRTSALRADGRYCGKSCKRNASKARR